MARKAATGRSNRGTRCANPRRLLRFDRATDRIAGISTAAMTAAQLAPMARLRKVRGTVAQRWRRSGRLRSAVNIAATVTALAIPSARRSAAVVREPGAFTPPLESPMTNPTSFDSQSDADNKAKSRAHVVRAQIARDDSGLVSTAPPAEKAILVGVDLEIAPQLLELEDSLTELALLARTAGVGIAGQITQRLETPNPATLIGTGKLEELFPLSI